MLLTYKDLLKIKNTNEIVWAYSFEIGNSKNGKRISHLRACKCIISCSKYDDKFLCIIPLSEKTGNPIESKKKYISYHLGNDMRDYPNPVICDNEEEAKKNYNVLVDERIKEIKEEIEELENLKF